MSTTTTTLFFFSGSADKPPGKGAHEYLADDDDVDCDYLKSVSNWRQVLSNFWSAAFEFKQRHYSTAEYAFQASKFVEIGREDVAHEFCLESNSELSKSNGAAARRARMIVRMSSSQLKHWDGVKHEILHAILTAKFSQVSAAREVLLATKHARLLHSTGRGSQPVRQVALENVRQAFIF